MKKANIKKLTLLSMFSALIIGMTFIPYVGYITIPGMLSITTVHIMVIIGAIAMNDFISGTVLGAVWGFSCLAYALYNGTADAAIFLDPRISVIPRILVGFLTVAFYKLAKNAAKNKMASLILKLVTAMVVGILTGLLCHNITSSMIASIIVGSVIAIACVALFIFYSKTEGTMPIIFTALCGTFSNTTLVLFAINLFGTEGFIQLTGTIKNIFSTIIALNGSIEVVAAVIITVPCCMALKKIKF